MSIDKVLITGSCGLVGSEASRYFCNLGSEVVGIDNNHRKDWFGEAGDTSPVKEELKRISKYRHMNLNIVDENAMREVIGEEQPDLIIHAAGQPSHEKSAEIPLADFKVNALGTINLLEATRNLCPNAIFVFVSTNKVYGELTGTTRPVDDYFALDKRMKTPFGASKAAADLMVQEYGLYYGMKTVCFRCGCITGRNHKGVEQHGFLSYLCKCAKENIPYTIYGYHGEQVRDNIHAYDLATAFHEFAKNPKEGVTYNIGGGHNNSASLNEIISMIKKKGFNLEVSHGPKRKGDHFSYKTDLYKFQIDYPDWNITRDLHSILDELLMD